MKHIIGGKEAAETPSARQVPVGEDFDGQRLDNFLLRELKGVPKTHVYRIIRSGEVRLNKGRAQADSRVSTGDLVRVPPVRVAAPSAPESVASTVPPREFSALYEDEHLLAIDKPAGTAVHGGSGLSFGVIEQIRRARPQASFLELVHRLDRETSGILLVAKKRSALLRLQEQFRARETGKTYLALVSGSWIAKHKVIDRPLHKFLLPDGERRVRTTTPDDPDGMRAISLVAPQRVYPERSGEGLPPMSLLEVTIKTGRTHQIRVHLASAGHPIAGDDKYGDFSLNRTLAQLGLRRMFLHAWRLQFDHPSSGERISLEAALPPELKRWIDPA